MDCMDGMKGFPDGFFDLAIVDPPYGDGKSGGVRQRTTDSEEDSTVTKKFVRFNNSGRQKKYTIMRGGTTFPNRRNMGSKIR